MQRLGWGCADPATRGCKGHEVAQQRVPGTLLSSAQLRTQDAPRRGSHLPPQMLHPSAASTASSLLGTQPRAGQEPRDHSLLTVPRGQSSLQGSAGPQPLLDTP